MRKYIKIIISLVASVIIFSILMYIEKISINKDNLSIVYILNTDTKAYTEINENLYDELYLKNTDIEKYSYINDENILNNMVTSKDLKKGVILSNDILIDKTEKENSIKETNKEIVLININNDSKIGKLLKESNYINLYITLKDIYLPNNISKLKKIEYKSDKINSVTFLYLEKFNSYSIIYEDEITKEKIASIALKLNSEQATYINSIKDIANFEVSII